MADVFISYSRLDSERVKPIAERLTSLGYSVWWDKTLRAGEIYADESERQLEAARAVLVVWTHSARNATWVYAEASRALDARKCVQMRLDNVARPLPFDALPVAEMSGGKSEWGQLEDKLTRLVRDGAAQADAAALGPLATPAATGAPKTLTIALGATLAAYAGAVSAAYNGLMSPEQLQIALVGMIGVAGACAALSAHRLVTIARAGG